MEGTLAVPKTLAAIPTLTTHQKLLLTLIASTARTDRPCDLTLGQMAHRLGKHRTTVARSLQGLTRGGYVITRPFLAPLPRAHARMCYQLPPRIWRIFLRAWAMIGPYWRKLAKEVKDWIEPHLPMHLLSVVYVPKKNGRPPDGTHIRTKLSNGAIRETQNAPHSAEQLEIAGLVELDGAQRLVQGFRKGLRFLSPERRAMVAQQAGLARS